MTTRRLEILILLLFVVSGFAGLIYQSIWSQYLGLMLGHAAYAQTLVLAMFMGGMAIGAWLVSRWSSRWRNLILVYAIAEAAIGVMALVFHGVFLAYRDFTYDIALSAIGSPAGVDLYLWGTSAMLIAPQTVLLGATFPLMSSGYLRVAPREDSRILGGLYFSNSLGAAFGALASTFLLVPKFGLPGTLLTAGLLNLLVALGAWAVAKGIPLPDVEDVVRRSSPVDSPSCRDPRLARLLLWAAATTGATSFVYEVGWVRLLNQSMGSSLHSFELMLSAFILGLALGGRWIRQKSSVILDALQYSGMAQVLMGLAALLSLPIFAHSFGWVAWLRTALQHTDTGYALMSLGGSIIAVAVMVPAAFFAGMTLPLFTASMLRNGSGEAGVGRIYAANTLGAISGVFAVVHLLIPVLGVHGSIVLAGVIDILLGFVLLHRSAWSGRASGYVVLTATSVFVLSISLHYGRSDPRSQAAGAFRTGLTRYDDSVKVDFLRDGKTATISVVTDLHGARIIATNGKSDAGLQMSSGEPFADEVTMVILGVLPVMLNPDAERLAIIGWGSGLSTHTALGSSRPKSVETIEIERAMYEGAKRFGSRVERAYLDPRSSIFFNDARTHFSRNRAQYDAILSEPSNPWVAGVASLFTREFYQSILPHLKDDGVFIQWLQMYEINDRLAATMVASLLETFPNVDVYESTTGDIIFVGRKTAGKDDGALRWEGVDTDALRSEMARVGLSTVEDWQLRHIGNAEILRAFVRMMKVSPHSDFFPVVAHQAPASMFKSERAMVLRELAENGMPILDALIGREPPGLFSTLANHQDSLLAQRTLIAGEVLVSLQQGKVTTPLYFAAPGVAGDVAFLQQHAQRPLPDGEISMWMAGVSRVANASIGFLPAKDHQGIWSSQLLSPRFADSASVGASLLAAYQGLAERKYALAATAAKEVLSSGREDIPLSTREHMLLILVLDAAVRGQYAEMIALESEIGRAIPLSSEFGSARRLLMAWAELRLPRE